MASATYAVVCHDIDVRMQVEALNELAIVAHHIIAYKAVKLLGDFILIKDSAYDSPLDGPSMASKKVAVTVPTWPFTEPLDPSGCAITTRPCMY
jgi:hypothetical protein